MQAGQADDPHEKELCCSDHVDPNPVNCISHKILGTFPPNTMTHNTHTQHPTHGQHTSACLTTLCVVVSKDEFLVIEKTIQRELEAQFPGLKSVALHKVLKHIYYCLYFKGLINGVGCMKQKIKSHLASLFFVRQMFSVRSKALKPCNPPVHLHLISSLSLSLMMWLCCLPCLRCFLFFE